MQEERKAMRINLIAKNAPTAPAVLTNMRIISHERCG